MSWLPFEDEIAGKSEELIKKYSPNWSGAGYKRYDLTTPSWVQDYFDVKELISFDTFIPFTKDSWNGRMKACRGVAASLTYEEIQSFELEHKELLDLVATDEFSILHFVTMIILKKK